MTENREISLSPIKEMELRASRIPGVISLAQGVPSFDTPETVKNAAIEAIEKGKVAKYSLAPGTLEFRETIAQHLEKENKFFDFEKEIIATAGSIEAITATLLAILRAGRRGFDSRSDLHFLSVGHQSCPRSSRFCSAR